MQIKKNPISEGLQIGSPGLTASASPLLNPFSNLVIHQLGSPSAAPPAHSEFKLARLSQHHNNTMSAAAARGPAPDFKATRAFRQNLQLGYPYRILPIRSFDVLVGNLEKRRSYDVVTSGTYFFKASGSHKGKIFPSGPLVVNGQQLYNGVNKSTYRGGVAILSDGKVVMGRQNGNSLGALQNRFGKNLKHFMGGGTLIIENGKRVSHSNIFNVQQFKQSRSMTSGQLAFENSRIAMGIKNGQAYVMYIRQKTGKQIQNELLREGFGTVILFDGGRKDYFRMYRQTLEAYPSPFGFGFKVK